MPLIRTAYLIAGTAIMIVALALGLFLGLTSFDIEQKDAYGKLYLATTTRVKEFVQTGLQQGKTLGTFSDIESQLAAIRIDDKRVIAALVTDPAGKLLFNDRQDEFVSGNVRSLGIELPGKTGILNNTHSRNYWFGQSIERSDGEAEGWVLVEVSGEEAATVETELIRNQIIYIVALVLAGVAAMALLLKRFFKRSRVVIALIVTATQLLYGLVAISSIHHEYSALFVETAERQTRFLNDDAHRLLSLGVEPERWSGMSTHIRGMLFETDVAHEIAIYDASGRVLYSATRDSERYVVNPDALGKPVLDTGRVSTRPELLPLRYKGVVYGYIEARIDDSLIKSKLIKLALELATVLLVSSLFAVEFTRMATVLARRKRQGSPASLVDSIRASSFVFHMAALAPLSFIPLYLNEILLQTIPAANDFAHQNLLSVLMTAYMAGVALAVPVSIWLQRVFTVRSMLLTAATCFVAGTLGTWLIHDYTPLFLFRVLAGLGFGLVAMSGNALVAALSSSLRYSVGTRSWTGGFSSAAVCAFSLGGLIAERFGYTGGIVLSVVLMLCAMVYVGFFGKRIGLSIRHQPEPFRLRDLGEVFKNRDVASLLVFAALPLQLAMIGLFQYLFPLYMSFRGIDQVDIGRMLAIYGIINMIAPSISRFRFYPDMLRIFVVSGNLIAGIILVYTYLADNIFVLLVAVAAIGISSLIFDQVMDAFLGRGPGGGMRQHNRSVVMYTTFERFIGSFVPVLTTLVVSLVGMTGTIAFIGFLAIAGAAGFALLSPHQEEQRA